VMSALRPKAPTAHSKLERIFLKSLLAFLIWERAERYVSYVSRYFGLSRLSLRT
jgi:hypothetical protein